MAAFFFFPDLSNLVALIDTLCGVIVRLFLMNLAGKKLNPILFFHVF